MKTSRFLRTVIQFRSSNLQLTFKIRSQSHCAPFFSQTKNMWEGNKFDFLQHLPETDQQLFSQENLCNQNNSTFVFYCPFWIKIFNCWLTFNSAYFPIIQLLICSFELFTMIQFAALPLVFYYLHLLVTVVTAIL